MFESLRDKHYCILPNFMGKDETLELLEASKNAYGKGRFTKAKIGRGKSHHERKDIRNAELCWIDNWSEVRELELVHTRLTEIQQAINENFFTSIKRFESQLSFYPTGGFYKKHLDQLKSTRNRQLTSILFLNDVKNGGELIIYEKEDKFLREAIIKPTAGTLVLFFSKTIYHEVLECQQDRYGLTTWFRDDELFLKPEETTIITPHNVLQN